MADERDTSTAASPEWNGETSAGGESNDVAPPAPAEAAQAEGASGADRAEIEALTDRHLRLAAEFDNYRKRVERERVEHSGRVQADLIRRLLDVLDDLQRVARLQAESTTVHALLEGVRLVEKKFRQVLENEGLEPIEAEGEAFDPEVMEALMTVPAEHPEEDDAVADVFQQGYRLRGNLIRPARVRVKKYED